MLFIKVLTYSQQLFRTLLQTFEIKQKKEEKIKELLVELFVIADKKNYKSTR